MRYALINNDSKKVVNVIELGEVYDWPIPQEHFLIPSNTCGIGDYWNEDEKDFYRPLTLLLPKSNE